MLSDMSQVCQFLNPEVNNKIEKIYQNMNLKSKEQQEKGNTEIYKYFLEKLSHSLGKGQKLNMADLILDKSIKISDIINNYDWDVFSSLKKLTNLAPNTSTIYTYAISRLHILSGKNKKPIKKEEINKAIDTLVIIINSFYDSKINLDDKLLYLCFEDLFSFYLLTNCNEKSKQEIEDLISFVKEETNIEGLSKMKNIDPIAEDNFYRGAIAVLFQFKLDLISQKNDIDLSLIENIFKHEEALRKKSILLNLNLVWYYTCYKMINEDNKENEIKFCEKCLNIYIITKNYLQFLLPSKSLLISIVSAHIEKIRSLIVLYFLKNHIILNNSLFIKLDYSQKQIDELKCLSLVNLFPIFKIVKNSKIDDYDKMKFKEKIEKKFKDIKDDNSGEEKRKFMDLIIKYEKDIEEKDIKNNEDYLKNVLCAQNKKFEELENMLIDKI
jgi:hypothetical protein